MLKRSVMLMLFGAALLALSVLPAGANLFTYTSNAGDVAAYGYTHTPGVTQPFVYTHDIFETYFTVTSTCDVRIWTHSMYDQSISPPPMGSGLPANLPYLTNFPSMVWVWNSAAESAALLAAGSESQYWNAVDWNTQMFPVTSGSNTFYFGRGDAGVVLPQLSPGTYRVSLTLDVNFPWNLFYVEEDGTLVPYEDPPGTPLPMLRSDNFSAYRYVEAGWPTVTLAEYDQPYTGDWRLSIEGSNVVTPIPGTVILLGTGLAGLLLARRRRS